MEMRQLGSAGPVISVVGFGAWEAGGTQWGPNESEATVIAAMRAALDAGMTWIDTAETYGKGTSEQLVGKAIQGRRDELQVFTKVGPSPVGTGFRPDEVANAARESLRRLGTDHVDLYQLHWPDETGVPVEETWGAMASLVDEGLARHIGVSNFDRDLIERCEAVRHVDSLQNEFSLLRRGDLAELLPWLDDRGIGYLAYGPLGFGILSGGLRPDHRFADDDWRSGSAEQDEDWEELFSPGRLPAHLERVERLRAVADRLGTTPAPLALRWAVDQVGVTAAIAGSRNAGHVRENAETGSLKLDDATRGEISKLFDA
jgi:aryl-alcohol dehydrogenase-like predicted oxidoreductase